MSSYQYELKNVYLGYEFEPSSSTVMYYPFKDDQLDKVWGSSIWTTWTKQDLGYTFNSTSSMTITNPKTTCRFLSMWIKFNSSLSWNNQTATTYIWWMCYNFNHNSATWLQKFQYHSSASSGDDRWPRSNTVATTTWTWYHMAYWTDGSKVYAYLNGQKVWEANITPWLATETSMMIWWNLNITLSELICESSVRDADKVLNYYNQTKSLYWITN